MVISSSTHLSVKFILSFIFIANQHSIVFFLQKKLKRFVLHVTFGISICNLNIQYYAIPACVSVIIGISFNLLWIIQLKKHIHSLRFCSFIQRKNTTFVFLILGFLHTDREKGIFQFKFLKASTHNWLTLLLQVCHKVRHHFQHVQQNKTAHIIARQQNGRKGKNEGGGFESHYHL